MCSPAFNSAIICSPRHAMVVFRFLFPTIRIQLTVVAGTYLYTSYGKSDPSP